VNNLEAENEIDVAAVPWEIDRREEELAMTRLQMAE
jgi:hypothetical protein